VEVFYTVQAGDTLYDIAQRYNTTVQAIMQANHLTSTNIYIGQQLHIPTAHRMPQQPGGGPIPANLFQRLDRLEGRMSRIERRISRIERQLNIRDEEEDF